MQVLDVPKELDVMLKKWVKLNPTDYLLFSSNKQPLSSSQINRILNSIFDGRHISCDMLRHIYLTHLYRNVPALTQMEKTAEDMGHSVATAMLYVKKE
jgi:integrase